MYGGVEADVLASFALASLLIEITPGPNMSWLAMVAATDGRRVGFASVAGVALGLAAIGIAAAFGVAQLISASDVAYEVLRWAGIAFLLYLAWGSWATGTDVATAPASHGAYFLKGLTTNLLNPKAAVFYVAVLPTFVDAGRPVLAQTLTLTATYVAIATFVHAGIVVAAGALQPVLNEPARERVVRRVLAMLLALVAAWFAWSTAR
jgi:threonine/homoserine/homoserine lactone efflux protein